MQNDSGNLPADDELIEGEELPSAREPEVDTPPQGQPAVARQPPWSEQLRETLAWAPRVGQLEAVRSTVAGCSDGGTGEL